MKVTLSRSITLLVFKPPLGHAWQNINHSPFGLFMTEQWPGPSQLLLVKGDLVLRIGLLEYFVYGPSALVDLATPTAQQSLLQPHPLQKRQQQPPYCTNHCPQMIPRSQAWSFFISSCGFPRVFMPVGSSKTAQNSVGWPCAFPSTLYTMQLFTPSLRIVASMTPYEAFVIKGAPLSTQGPRMSSEMAAPIDNFPDLSLAVKQTTNFLLMICSSGAQLSQQVVHEAGEGSTQPTWEKFVPVVLFQMGKQ